LGFTGWLDRRLDAPEARRARARDELAAIARRAELQNALVLAGDERGLYGDYPPESLHANALIGSFHLSRSTPKAQVVGGER
jgi:hypothetical protein